MHSPLYLDTARLGQMSYHACRASIDFARFATEHGSDLYLQQLLVDGFRSWPSDLRQRFSGLAHWQGVAELKTNLRLLAQADGSTEIALASRSASLMQFAAKLISGPCRNVLTTDLTWPAYGEILRKERRTADSRTTVCPIRDLILRDSLDSDSLVDLLVETYLRSNCDGLFLPLVDNLGIKLPIPEIVTAISTRAELRFVLVDAAQAIGQVPLELDRKYCDLLVAGCHKWLQAYTPMGFAFYGMRAGSGYVGDSLSRWLATGHIEDPLLGFIQELETGQFQPYGETVQLAPLFNANAAVVEALERQHFDSGANATAISEVVTDCGWNVLAPAPELRSKIQLFEIRAAKSANSHDEFGKHARACFLENGVALTAYDCQQVRVSTPNTPLTDSELKLLAQAFIEVAVRFEDSCR